MLAVALLGGTLMRRWGQPAVLGELIAGILLGPTLLGALLPAFYNWLFPSQSVLSTVRDAVLSLGMLFFLFVAGLEINLAWLKGRAKSIVLTSLFGILLPFALGMAAVFLWPAGWGSPATKNQLLLSIFIGTALSISALPVIARILIDLKLLDSEIGVIVITAAAVNDLIGWSLFAAVLGNLNQNSGTTAFIYTLFWVVIALALIWSVGYWLVRPLVSWLQRAIPGSTVLISLITIFILGAAALVEAIGIHPVFGAFQMGVALGQGVEQRKGNPAHDTIYQFALSFFAPLYFVSVGLKANFATNFHFGLVLLVIAIACVGKIGGAGLGAWLGGLNLRRALAIGSGLNARGAMEIILASVALEYGVIDQRIFVALVMMALVTSLISGPLLKALWR